MIDRQLLRYFLAVVDQGTFSKAATRCRVSQPTLSVGIGKLERLLGESLFHRSSRRVELTAAGTRLVRQARAIETAFVEAETRDRADAPRTLIRLGVLSTLPSAWIETALVNVRRAGLDEAIEVIEGRQRDLRGLLDRGRLDAALGVIDGDPRARDEIFRETYGLAMATDHPLARRDSLHPAEVAQETMIVRRNCEVLAETSRHFTAHGVRPFFAARTVNDDRAAAYVRAGLGITVMPRCFASQGLATPALEGFALSRTIGFLMDPDSVSRLERTRSLGIIAETFAAERAAVAPSQ